MQEIKPDTVVYLPVSEKNFDEMMRCTHSWNLNEGGGGGGNDYHYERNICVCRKCGKIKVSGHENGQHYSQEFHIDLPESIQAIVAFAFSIYPEHFKPIKLSELKKDIDVASNSNSNEAVVASHSCTFGNSI
jgi:hypothetical protein